MTEAVINQNQQAQAFSPFGKRNANKDKIEQEEAELKQLAEDKSNPPEDNNGDDSNLSAEEKSFKKRYGDLRRHSQQQQTTLQKQIDELRSQLQSSTEKQIKLPKSEEELNEWARAYPDVAKIVETIAIKKAKEQTQALDERFKQLDEREHQTAKEKAEADLTRLHPDFDSIRDDDAFHNWVEEQPKWVQDALYDNESDAISAARAIDLYKADKGIKTKKSTSDKGAAESVNTRGSRSAPTGESKDGVFYESQVSKMIPDFQKTSLLIPSQLPSFVRENPDYDKFVTFLQAYYEWMEVNGNVTERSKNILNYKDIDRTTEEFLQYFTDEFLQYFPQEVLIDKRTAVKYARQLYYTKGTPASYQFLFRVLYDSDFDIFYTKDAVLKASDGSWYVARSLKLATGNTNFLKVNNYRLFGETTKSIATIENATSTGNRVEIFISDITRLFQSAAGHGTTHHELSLLPQLSARHHQAQ